VRDRKSYTSYFLCLFLVFCIGCSKDRNEQITETDKKLSEAQALIQQSEYTAAEVLLREAIGLNLELKRDSVLGDISLLIAQCHRWSGNYDSIPVTMENAMGYYSRAGTYKGLRKGITELARFYLEFGDYQASMLTATEAATSARMFQDTSDQLEALSISVLAARSLNQFDLSLGYAREMVEIDSIRYKSEYRSEISESMVSIFNASGKSEDIRLMIRELEDERDYKSLLRVYTHWGELCYRSGNLDSAVRLFSQGMMYMDKQTESSLKVKLLSYLGSVAYRSKRYDNARMYFLDALSVAKDAGNKSLECALEGILIACDWKYSDPLLRRYMKDFIGRASALVTECTSDGNRYGEMLGLALMVRMMEEGKDTLQTYPLCERLHAVNKSLYNVNRQENIEAQLLQLFLEGESYGSNTGLLQYSVEQGIHDPAFELIEEQNMLDINRFFSRLTITTRNETINSAVAAYQHQYRTAEMLWNDIEQEIEKGKNSNQERIRYLQNIYNERVTRLKDAAQNIWRASPNIGRLFRIETPSLMAIRDSLLEDDAVTEYFHILDTLYFMVIRKDTSYIVRGSRSATKTLALVTEYNRLLGDSRLNSYQDQGPSGASAFRIDELSRLIGDALLTPLYTFLDGVKHMYIVPPVEYGMLPFHTLRLGDTYLANEYFVHYLPTAAILLMSNRETGEIRQVSAVGHPGSTNWDIEYELRDIRSFFEDAGMIFNQDATLSAIENTTADVLHLGAEFKLDTDYPDNTTCALSNGKSLYGPNYIPVGKMLRIPNPQVLILSNITAEGGMLRRYVPLAFLANGTPTVIASMWRGDRRAKRAFGEAFYTALKEGKPVADAFHGAVKELISQSEFSKPQRWGLYYSFGKR
jgi:CHAT domain-containing protein